MASTSPLSSLSSSRQSFYTAAGASDAAGSTAASTPVQSHPSPYCDARPLPRELKEHCHILLEEQLYTSALGLLNSTLASGASRRHRNGKAVPVPPPSHLALLNTLLVLPSFTTRVDHLDQLDVPSLILDYLRNVLTTVGPIKADLRTAFQFNARTRGARRSGFSSPRGGSDISDDETDRYEDRLNGPAANGSSIWNRGQDFWSTVGWAFNCSALHPQRWRYWKTWLEYMLDVLEADWSERERMDLEAAAADSTSQTPSTWREHSILWMYMNQQNGRSVGVKSIIKSLVAEGSSISSVAFQEIFERELRVPRGPSKKRKREQQLDLENDQFGDYLDDESASSGMSEPPTPEKPRDARKGAGLGSTSPGLADSVHLRLRLFSLVASASVALKSPKEVTQLFEDFAVAIKMLPLQMYSLFISQRPGHLLPEAHVTIFKELFHRLLPSSYKDPRKVDREADAEGSLSMRILEHCYICYPANTVAIEDNAKLSLAVESAMQLLWVLDLLKYSDSFAQSARRGIEARETKAKKKRTGKAHLLETSDAVALDTLRNSAARIEVLLEVTKACS